MVSAHMKKKLYLSLSFSIFYFLTIPVPQGLYIYFQSALFTVLQKTLTSLKLLCATVVMLQPLRSPTALLVTRFNSQHQYSTNYSL